MLGIAASGSPNVLPEHQVLVVDEAHELTDRVTAQATAELSLATIEHAARLARRHGGVPTTDLDSAGQALATVLVALPEGRFPRGLPRRRARRRGQRARRVAHAAQRAQARDRAERAAPRAAARWPQATMLALFEVADRMAADPDDNRHTVLWCARSEDRRGSIADPPARRAARRERAHPHPPAGRAVGACSRRRRSRSAARSTRSPARSGSRCARTPSRSGPPRWPARRAPRRAGQPWHGLDVGSPFDYPQAGDLLRRAAPAAAGPRAGDRRAARRDRRRWSPRPAAAPSACSRRAVRPTRSRPAMRERLDVPVLLQGDDQLPTLVAQFAADEPTCLFGTLSLWQGVDVPGASCRLVLIDRIPFPRPDDPVRSARSDAIEAGGRQRLHGGLRDARRAAARPGRRSADPRPARTAASSRCSTRGSRTARLRRASSTRSMPDFWRTTDRAVAVSALARGSRTAAG